MKRNILLAGFVVGSVGVALLCSNSEFRRGRPIIPPVSPVAVTPVCACDDRHLQSQLDDVRVQLEDLRKQIADPDITRKILADPDYCVTKSEHAQCSAYGGLPLVSTLYRENFCFEFSTVEERCRCIRANFAQAMFTSENDGARTAYSGVLSEVTYPLNTPINVAVTACEWLFPTADMVTVAEYQHRVETSSAGWAETYREKFNPERFFGPPRKKPNAHPEYPFIEPDLNRIPRREMYPDAYSLQHALDVEIPTFIEPETLRREWISADE